MGGGLKKFFAAAIFFLVVGGMAWGWMAMTNKNPVFQIFGKWAWIIYGIVGISAFVVLLTGRNAYLPFLGPTVFPCAALENKVPEGADTKVEVQVRPGVKVLYWASEPDMAHMKVLKTWKEAYGGYQNVGVATADENGRAVLHFRNPQPYVVPLKGRIESHVHYRMCLADGWLSQVETHMLHSEPFIDVPNMNALQVPVLAQSEEMPVIADPVSGLPTAVPADVLAAQTPESQTVKEKNEQQQAAIEGFSNEPTYSSMELNGQLLKNEETEDPRLLRLRSNIEADSLKVVDDMAFDVGSSAGVDLDAAFQPSLKPSN